MITLFSIFWIKTHFEFTYLSLISQTGMVHDFCMIVFYNVSFAHWTSYKSEFMYLSKRIPMLAVIQESYSLKHIPTISRIPWYTCSLWFTPNMVVKCYIYDMFTSQFNLHFNDHSYDKDIMMYIIFLCY